MGRSVPFACVCGVVHGSLDVTPRGGRHLTCACKSCRSAEVHLGQPDPGAAGVAIYQTTPDRITIDAGHDRLAVMRLSPKGLFRWHATCCNSPLFNTMPGPGLPFVGVLVARIPDPDPLGPVMARVNIPTVSGKPRNEGIMASTFGLLRRAMQAKLTGRGKRTPFFSPDGSPTAPVHVISLEDRQAAEASLTR